MLLFKSTEKYFKEEFVTAGGIDLKEINFKPWKVNCMKTSILLEKLSTLMRLLVVLTFKMRG
jgi:hypothetical protein